MNIGDIFMGLRVDPSGELKTEVEKSAKTAGTAGGTTLGKAMSDSLGRAMAGVGAIIGTGLASSVQEFVKFDDQMRTVYSLLPDISEDAMTEMEDQVKGLAVEMGRLPEDIIPGLYDALSSGIPQDNVFAFMEAATKAAVAGGADTQDTVKVLASTINAFGLDVEDTTGLTDSFFNAINKGVTTFPELSASMSGVTPTAAAMGLSIDDVLASITAMTLQGTPTAQAVTGINASLVALQRTTPAMEQALKNLGFETGQAALNALGYQGTMEALRGEADRLGVPLIELTGRMEGSAAMLQLTGENAAKANELLDSFGDTAGATTEAFETMEGGVGGAARRLAAQVKVTLIDIGEQFQALGPIFTAFGPTMGRLLGAGIGAVGGLVASGFRVLANSAPVKAGTKAAGALMTRLLGDAMDVGLRGLAFAKNAALDMASKLSNVMKDAWSRVATSRIGVAAADLIGSLTGKAQALAHEIASTGVSAIRSFLTKFGLMTPAKIGAATAAGTATGTAEGSAAAAAAATGASGGGKALQGAGLGLGSLFGIAFVAAGSIPILAWLDDNFGMSPETAEANAIESVKPMGDALTAWAAQQKANMGGAGAEAVNAFIATFREGSAGLDLNDTAAWTALTEKSRLAAVAAGLIAGDAWASNAEQSVEAAAAREAPLGGEAWAMATMNGFANANWGAATTAVAAHGREVAQAGQFAMMDVFKNGDGGAAAEAAHGVIAALNRGLQESIPSAHSAWESFVAGMGKELDPLEELAWLKGRLSGQKLATGLASQNPFARQNAEDMRDTIVGEIAALERLLGIEGEQGGAAVVTELNKKKGPAGTAASGVASTVVSHLDFKDDGRAAGETGVGAFNAAVAGGAGKHVSRSTASRSGPGRHYTTGQGAAGAAGAVRGAVVATFSDTSGFAGYGSSTTGEYADGIVRGGGAAIAAARAIARAVRDILQADSPPRDPLLHDIGKWGTATIEEYASGLLRGLGAVKGAVTTVASQLTTLGGSPFDLSPVLMSGTATAAVRLEHDVRIHGDGAEHLDERKVADYLNDGAAGLVWNLEHAMSAVRAG